MDMNRNLNKVLHSIADEYRNDVLDGARNYIEIDIGKRAEALGYPELKKQYNNVNVIVPIKEPEAGMKVRIDGRTFVNYARYAGIGVPGYVAKDAGIQHETFVPNDNMILNFV
jgi:hypothetical protein